MRMRFFHLNFLNARGILAQNIYHVRAIFRQLSDVKDGYDPNSQVFSVSWLSMSPKAPELAVLRKADLIFQLISLSNATLFSIVFFGCGVHKLKVGLSPSKKIFVICLTESPLKMTKNAFYFILIALFVSRYLSFCHDFLIM